MVPGAALQRGTRAGLAGLAPFALAFATIVAAQQPPPNDPPPVPVDRERIAAAAERWLAGDQASRDELDAVVRTLLEDPAAGIDWLAAQLPGAAQAASARARAVHGLIVHFTLGYLQQQRATQITFQGQYAALARLQPVAGDFLFGLLLETPDWYPTTHRIHVVAPLRDLQPRLPEPARVDAIERIIDDAQVEPEGLRRALAALLWQWDRKRPAQAMIERLTAATADGDAEERVQTTLELADFYNQLREYRQAAGAHRAAQALAKDADVALKPIAWYAAACVHALLGDVERGLAAIERCAALQASPDLDSSLRLSRSMFDRDPELASLRAHPRWAELMRRAFPAMAPEPDGGR